MHDFGGNEMYDTDSKLSAVYPADQQNVTVKGITTDSRTWKIIWQSVSNNQNQNHQIIGKFILA